MGNKIEKRGIFFFKSNVGHVDRLCKQCRVVKAICWKSVCPCGNGAVPEKERRGPRKANSVNSLKDWWSTVPDEVGNSNKIAESLFT